MFGYRNIKWSKTNKKTWISDCSRYEISKDDYIYTSTQKKIDESINALQIFDYSFRPTLSGAKTWCNETRKKEYLDNLQQHINNTSRYGKAGE